jgi:hypothetical protein
MLRKLVIGSLIMLALVWGASTALEDFMEQAKGRLGNGRGTAGSVTNMNLAGGGSVGGEAS